MASERRKFFVDTFQLALALRRSELTATAFTSGCYYLEYTTAQLQDYDGEVGDVFKTAFLGDFDKAKKWQNTVWLRASEAVKAGRGAFRERHDIRRLHILNKIIHPFLEKLLGESKGIEARNFHDALRNLRFYFDVV